MCIACVRDGIQDVTLIGVEENVALENARTAAESTASENATTESTARKTCEGLQPSLERWPKQEISERPFSFEEEN